MAEENTKVQFNLWLEKETLEWLNLKSKEFPITTSVNELIRQCIRDKREIVTTGDLKSSFFDLLN